MTTWTILLIAVGVSADAFAAALSSGLRMRTFDLRHAVAVAATFGAFQAVMPLLGWGLASRFTPSLTAVGQWVAFALLVLIGARMIREAFTPHREQDGPVGSGWRRLVLLGLATSIDAATVGVSFAVLEVHPARPVLVIGAVTLAASFAAVVIGHRVGVRHRGPAEFAGGLILVGIGVRIVLQHLGVLA